MVSGQELRILASSHVLLNDGSCQVPGKDDMLPVGKAAVKAVLALRKQSTDLRGPPGVLGQLGPHDLAGPAVRLYLRIVAAPALRGQPGRLPRPAAARLHAEPCSGQCHPPIGTPAKGVGTWCMS